MSSPSLESQSLLPIILASLVSWGSVSGLMRFLQGAPSWVTVSAHIFFTASLFSIVFTGYYQIYKNAHPFTTAAVAVLAYITAEIVFWTLAFPDAQPYHYTYLDWVIPLFIATSVIYFAGVLFRQPKIIGK
ncbi:TPA: hypothetical protein DEP34_05175 [Candidatus Uhrbacteria bacterium]|uniref:Uncharacterized protein n=2 Tax=Candidatus Uhriibacteriota TaxID=1752732 RepID=A0A0G1Q5H6_9BACT|nr:MAG: hypothetical protein UX45_C0029G0004 [Candidatus Uhrbacteria bacterium GW2011_GWF2_46_218]KKU40296.1 MAG: hypothetical protein UX57_C0020G0004 [Candidatus Uhrbacteria bacterium GW2011_GWE2_46_68]HBK33437.1 hypothetical protein [Candidatus Uhrbacteria bacterium]HCB19730.1 hypothetical protein [Candidatus Uhrbacteria bacterium]